MELPILQSPLYNFWLEMEYIAFKSIYIFPWRIGTMSGTMRLLAKLTPWALKDSITVRHGPQVSGVEINRALLLTQPHTHQPYLLRQGRKHNRHFELFKQSQPLFPAIPPIIFSFEKIMSLQVGVITLRFMSL